MNGGDRHSADQVRREGRGLKPLRSKHTNRKHKYKTRKKQSPLWLQQWVDSRFFLLPMGAPDTAAVFLTWFYTTSDFPGEEQEPEAEGQSGKLDLENGDMEFLS